MSNGAKEWASRANKPEGIAPFNLPEPVARKLKSTLGKYDTDKSPGGVTLPLDFHHAIPSFTLNRFCNELFKREHFEVFKEFLALSGCPKAQFADLPNQVKSGLFFAEQLVPGKPGWSLTRLVTWGEWNLVRGPKWRKDNPTEGEFDYLHSHASEKDTARLIKLELLFETMENYIRSPAAYTSREVAMINEIKKYRLDTSNAKAVLFNEDMWRIDPNPMAKYDPVTKSHPLWYKKQ